ncbi:MAG: protein-glutamate O-methyltransferase CheR [Acidobacteriaceae bacterium]
MPSNATTTPSRLTDTLAAARSDLHVTNKSVALRPDNYRFLQEEIRRGSGIVLGEDKHYLFESRLTPVLRRANLETLDQLCEQLRSRRDPDLTQQVLEALTTNETFFFRDMAPFEAMRACILPEIVESLSPHQKLRVWSAAASSGQEAYSMAMMFRELNLQERCAEILGTDISEQVLVYAKEAKYLQFEVNRGLPAIYLVKYFKREELDWRLNPEIRSAVRFKQFDLRQSAASLGKFHIILCRNVLIYFDSDTKQKILEELWNALEPGGFLLLGSAESIPRPHSAWERISDHSATIYKKL